MADEPRFDAYSIEELMEAASSIDRERFPDRAARLDEALRERRSGVAPRAYPPSHPLQATPPGADPTPRDAVAVGRKKSRFAYVWILNSVAMLLLLAFGAYALNEIPSDYFGERAASTGRVIESAKTAQRRSALHSADVSLAIAALLTTLTLIGGFGLHARRPWSIQWLVAVSGAWILFEGSLLILGWVRGWSELSSDLLVKGLATMGAHAIALGVVLLLSRQFLRDEAKAAGPGNPEAPTPGGRRSWA